MIRVALIGGGPKGLFALQALHERLTSELDAHIAIDVYDPLPPGSGSVWREGQPEVLRLNVNAGIVDASSSINAENFPVWVSRVAPELAAEKYPPRALVGRYLREQFQLLSQHGNFAMTHAPYVVTGVEQQGPRWQVSGSFGSARYDEILLATGHGLAGTAPKDPLPGALNTHPFIGDYFALTTAGISAESAIWIRGAALTAYDVALLLTEGRGGSWQGQKDDSGAGHSGAGDGSAGDGAEDCVDAAGLRYIASGREPRRITLSCRSGSLMDPKSETVPMEVADCLNRHGRRLRQWGGQARAAAPQGEAPLNGMWAVLLDCARECAELMGATVSALSLWRTAWTGLSADAGPGAASRAANPPTLVPPAPVHEPIPTATADAFAHLRHSLAVNGLKAPVTTGWLWARVWSGLYAELVTAMDRLPRSTRAWRQFTRVARNLERFAFGPPELTARKLLALFDVGILHLAEPGEQPAPEAVLIDAVTPAPGVLGGAAPGGRPANGLFAGLLRAGHVSIRSGDRGLFTDVDGTCIAHDGTRTASLAALGRPTEDPTLGHDTLNRSLHGEHGLWAQRLAARATGQHNTPEIPDTSDTPDTLEQ
ncbi:MAG: FAD/NAD(P)-binding protein [Specibacter sp.]